MDQNQNQNSQNNVQNNNHLRDIENDDIEQTNLDETPDVMLEKLEDEEFATEFTADDSITANDENDSRTMETNNVIGWVAVALSVLSLFMMPVLLGGAGIIVGFISRNRNAEWLGNTAIIVGVISILLSLFFTPFR